MARDPASAFLAGFTMMDQLETNRANREWNKQVQSRTRTLWQREDREYERALLDRKRNDYLAQVDVTGAGLMEEASPAMAELWRAKPQAFYQEIMKRMIASDPEFGEHVALSVGLDPAQGPLVRNKRRPVSGVVIIPPSEKNGWKAQLAFEVDSVNGPQPHTDGRTSNPNDPVTTRTLDMNAMGKIFGPGILGNQYRIARLMREMTGIEQPGPTASTSGPRADKKGTTKKGTTQEEAPAGPDRPQATVAGQTADNPEVVDLEGLFNNPDTASHGPSYADEEAARAQETETASLIQANIDATDAELEAGRSRRPRVSPDQGLIDNVGPDAANNMAATIEGEISGIRSTGRTLRRGETTLPGGLKVGDFDEATGKRIGEFGAPAVDRWGNRVPTRSEISNGLDIPGAAGELVSKAGGLADDAAQYADGLLQRVTGAVGSPGMQREIDHWSKVSERLFPRTQDTAEQLHEEQQAELAGIDTSTPEGQGRYDRARVGNAVEGAVETGKAIVGDVAAGIGHALSGGGAGSGYMRGFFGSGGESAPANNTKGVPSEARKAVNPTTAANNPEAAADAHRGFTNQKAAQETAGAVLNSQGKKPTFKDVYNAAGLMKLGVIDQKQFANYARTGSFEGVAARKIQAFQNDGTVTFYDMNTLQNLGTTVLPGVGSKSEEKNYDFQKKLTKSYFVNRDGDYNEQAHGQFLNEIHVAAQQLGLNPTNRNDLMNLADGYSRVRDFNANLTQNLLEGTGDFNPFSDPELSRYNTALGYMAVSHGVNKGKSSSEFLRAYGIDLRSALNQAAAGYPPQLREALLLNISNRLETYVGSEGNRDKARREAVEDFVEDISKDPQAIHEFLQQQGA